MLVGATEGTRPMLTAKEQTMTADRENKLKEIREAINDLGRMFDDLEGVDYKIIIESYNEDDEYVIGAEASNNWDRSWC